MIRGSERTSAGIRIIFLIPILFIILLSTPVSALDVPQLSGRVNDYAGMISPPVKEELNHKLAEIEKTDSTQIVILTIPSLEGDTIEDFSIRVAEKWKIGQKRLDNGILIIAAENDRKMRIEVGYGLEGKMTDLVSGRILDTIMKPAFRSGDYDRGFIETADAIIAVARGEFKAPPSTGQNPAKSSGLFFLVLAVILFLMADRRIIRSISGGAVLPLAAASLALPVVWSLILIPVGVLTGFLLHPYIPHMQGGSGHWGGFGGGFGGGGGFDGGFSGGGGGFGGGGASGDW